MLREKEKKCEFFLSSLYLSIRARGVVDESVLQEGSEDEKYTDSRPDVDSLGVGHWGQGVVD